MTLFTSSATLLETSANVTGNLNHNNIMCITSILILAIIIANAETPSSANESSLIYWPGNHVFTFIIDISTCAIVMVFSALQS